MKENLKLKPYAKFNFFKNYIILSSILGAVAVAVIESLILFFTGNKNLEGVKFIGISILIYAVICLIYYCLKNIKYKNIEYNFLEDKFVYSSLFGIKKEINYDKIMKTEVVQSEYQDKYDIGDILLLDNKNKKIMCLKNVEDVFDTVVNIMSKIQGEANE